MAKFTFMRALERAHPDIAKKIKEKAGDATEKGAMALHNRIGYPIYKYLRKKNDIPY